MKFAPTLALVAIALLSSACGKKDSTTSDLNAGCVASFAGTPWTPNVTGAAASNHSGVNTVTQTILTASGTVLGLADAVGATAEIDVPIDMSQDLGPYGSISLVAQVTSMPSQLTSGGIYPVLLYLSDGTSEFINLARGGAGNDCRQKGVFLCTSGSCDVNPACTTTWPSAYQSRSLWEMHQFPLGGMGYNSVNTFPNCNWPEGTISAFSSATPGCAFNSNFFPAPTGASAKLRTGTYHAKYALLASDYSTTGAGMTASFKVTVIKKTSTSSSVGGTVDLNVVLVGDKNVAASRTDKGKQNLDTLMGSVAQIYAQSGVAVKLGTVNAYEWPCTGGGQTYAAADLNALGTMFQAGNALIPAASEGKALNMFLVSTLGEVSTGLTTLGLSAGIGGTMLNGTPGSGLVFASFDKLDTYNPKCTAGSACPVASQDANFVDMGATISHEMGHYLGLNHPSERAGAIHDAVYDTPICTATGTGGAISISSCLNNDANVFPKTGKTCNTACRAPNGATYSSILGNFCAATEECEFNHLMWWSSKLFNEDTGTGDGNILSADSGKIINYNPFIQ